MRYGTGSSTKFGSLITPAQARGSAPSSTTRTTPGPAPGRSSKAWGMKKQIPMSRPGGTAVTSTGGRSPSPTIRAGRFRSTPLSALPPIRQVSSTVANSDRMEMTGGSYTTTAPRRAKSVKRSKAAGTPPPLRPGFAWKLRSITANRMATTTFTMVIPTSPPLQPH